ncbi:enoyl-CoA hydratase [Bacteroidota bacterium]|nr:enoyl-CoA hydratase [Bacteroidota bacterium]
MDNLVLYHTENRIAYFTLNRPDKRNALNPEMISALKNALTKAKNDDEAKVIVIKSSGTVFSAGADLEHLQILQKNSYEENLADSILLKELFEQIYTHPKIIIAQVEGAAIAGGCGLATVCDFTFSIPEAKFGYTEVKIGFVPAIVLIFLLRKIGEAKAKELLLTGKLIDVSQAVQFGLVNSVFSKEEIDLKVKEFATTLCNETSAQSLSTTKEMIGKVQELSLEKALSYAAEMNAKARGTEDCKKGIAAFLNKENLKW